MIFDIGFEYWVMISHIQDPEPNVGIDRFVPAIYSAENDIYFH